MDHNNAAEAEENNADRNLAKLANAGTIPYEAVATVAQAMATLAVSHRLAALYDLLSDEAFQWRDRVSK